MSKHTPGPWMIFPDGRIGSEICTTTVLWPGALGERGAGNTIGEAMANARLIAAAPDLLTACKMAARYLDALNDPDERADDMTIALLKHEAEQAIYPALHALTKGPQ